MNISDDNLLKGINQNKEEAYTAFFNLTYKNLCVYVDRFVQEQTAAEDIVQEIFIKFYEKKRYFHSILAVKVFFYRSVRNAAINYLKRRAKQENLELSSLEELLSDQKFSSTVVEQEVINELRNAIMELPPKCAKTIRLSMQGLKNQEIAEELDVSVNTVKTQKKIGYRLLKENLNTKLNLLTIMMQLVIE